MGKIKASKDQFLCVLATAIIVVGFSIERIIMLVSNPDKTASILMAMIYTLLLAVVYFILSKNTNPFYGLLVSLIGYKMMPPSISTLATTTLDGYVLYYIVQKVAIILFVVFIIRFYEMQGKTREIQPLPILSLMIMTVFFTQIGETVGKYFIAETGSMLYVYFAQYLCYALSGIIVVSIAYRSSVESMHFVACYEYLALAINIFRKLAVIVIYAINGEHISKSYYVWIVIYLAFAGIFALANKHKQESAKQLTNV